jgi:tetratricopeptide (TPR) repeat protein
LFFVFTLVAIVSAKTMVVDGVGYNKDGAIRNALRNAVEQCVGVRIGSRSLVDNFRLISDKIVSQADGFVSSYTVLSERNKLGAVEVRLSADVAITKLEDDLAAQKILYEIQNKPRIMVVLDERIEGRQLFEKTATHAFEQALIAHGFIVVDQERMEQIQKADQAAPDNAKDLASSAFKNGADLIISGAIDVSEATPKMIYGTQFYTVPIQMNARIVRADNAQIIASKIKQIKKNSQEPKSAANFGLATGGAALAEELIADLNQYWRSEAFNENRIEVVVAGLREKELNGFENAVRGFSMVRALRMRYIESEKALYDMELRGTIQDLRAEIGVKPPLGLAIKAMTEHRMTLYRSLEKQPITFEKQMPEVEISDFSIQDIFPGRIRYYENNPVAHVAIKAGEKALTNVKVGVLIPGLMILPAEMMVDELAPGQKRDLSLNLVFNVNEIMKIVSTRTEYGQATVSFNENGRVVERKLTVPVKIYEKNTMDWNVLASLGGFVTYRDPVVNDFARKVVHMVQSPTGSNPDLFNGMSLFTAMNALGIVYMKDPASSPGLRLLDRVQYPVETLKSKSGDCDDLSTLYAALLSAVGIRAAVISYPDHVLVMFDTGIFEKNRLALSADTSLTVAYQGTLWIPVETTMVGSGFVAAWRAASKEYHSALAEGERIGIIDLDEAWKSYPPAPIRSVEMAFDLGKLREKTALETSGLENLAQSTVAQTLKELQSRLVVGSKNLDSVSGIFNTMGILMVRQNNYKEAAEYFQKAIKLRNDRGICSNHACAVLLSGDEDGALKELDAIYGKDPSGRVAVNRALCLYAKAQGSEGIDAFVKALKEAAAMMPSSRKLAEYLGIDLGNDLDLKGANEHEEQRQKEVNLRRLKELIRKRVISNSGKAPSDISGTTAETSTGSMADTRSPLVMPFGGIRGADPTQITKIIDLIYWFEKL